MRLLMLTQGMDLGGAETHVLELSRELVRSGDAVTVVSSGGALVPLLEEAGVRHVTLPFQSLSPLAFFRCLKGLSRLLDEEHFDFVHAHARRPAFFLSILARRRNDVRAVSTCHGAFRITPLLSRLSFWGDAVLAVSEDLKDYLLHHYRLAPGQIHLSVNGIDTARFYPTKKERTARHILAVSRLDDPASAGVEMLLRVFPRLRERYPDVTLTVVGGGERENVIKQEAAKRGLTPGPVRFTGALSDVREELARADFFVGVSRAALEAASCGLPVLLAGAEGLLGLPRSEADWLFFGRSNWCRGDALTEEGLLAALTDALADPDSFSDLGETARRFVLSHVSLAAMAETYRAFYRSQPPRLFFRDPEVVFSGYYGHGNAGDDAMLASMLRGIRRRLPDARLRVIAKNPGDTAKRYGVSAIGRMDGFAILHSLRSGTTLVSGGGTLLQDATSRRSLRYYTTLLSLARRRGCPTAIYAAGVGPLLHKRSRRLAAKAALSASRISVRDEGAKEALCRLGVSPDAVFSGADPVFLDLPEKRVAATDYFAVSVMRSAVDFPPGSDFDTWLTRLAEAVKTISKETGLSAVFVPMQREKDGEFSRRCARLAGATVRDEDPAAVLSAAVFVIGMRLHALVFAAAAGRCALGLSTDPKITGFAAAMGFFPPLSPRETGTDAIVRAARECLDGEFSEENRRALRDAAEADLDALCRLIRQKNG